MQFVYILKCVDSTYYTGCASDLEARLERHNHGYVEYTKTRLPVELVFIAPSKTKLMLSPLKNTLSLVPGLLLETSI
jgi:predicted GIY-YIG superfamily endonuclease